LRLQIPLPIAPHLRHTERRSGHGDHQELRAIIDSSRIFTPGEFTSISLRIFFGEMVMNANYRAFLAYPVDSHTH